MEEREKNTEKKAVKNFMSKVSETGKKVVGNVQKGVKNFSEQSQKKKQEREIEKEKNKREDSVKKYNPLFPDVFQSDNFHLPNVINIVDDAVRRGIDVCEGAIGWIEKVGKGKEEDKVEVLYLYDEFVEESNIQFIPFAACDTVYSIDPFEKGKFINTDTTFERTLNEKLAELEHIAYCLGAKSCSIQIVVSDKDTSNVDVNGKVSALSIKGECNSTTANNQMKNLKNITYFEGNTKTKLPKLKWFAFDENINGLIEMRRLGKNMIKSKVLELNCSVSKTMSHKMAVAVDAIKKCKIGGTIAATVKSVQEQNTKLVFEVEF